MMVRPVTVLCTVFFWEASLSIEKPLAATTQVSIDPDPGPPGPAQPPLRLCVLRLSRPGRRVAGKA
jgi:hypothetical protein